MHARTKLTRGRFGRFSRLGSLAAALAVTAAIAACTTTPPEEDAPGALVIIVNGLPGGAAADVTVTGPSGFSEQLTASDTLAGLTVGSYSVTAGGVGFEGVDYAAAVTGTPAAVTPNGVTTATVTYTATSLAPGSMTVTVTGLPGGVAGDVTVTGPSGTQQVTASSTLTALEPGIYTVSAAEVDDDGDIYAATVTGSPATVPAGGTTAVTVAYSFLDPAAFGALSVSISGLPVGVNAAVNVSGPGGVNQNLTASGTLSNLTPGNYVVGASDVSSGDLTYTAVVESSPVLVIPESTASVSVTYLAVAVNDGDAQSNPGWSARFRVTSGNPVRVEDILFNSAAPLDVKGIQIANEIGNPADPGDWLEFELIHGQSNTSRITVQLECLTAFTGTSPIRAEVRDDTGAKIGLTINCGTTRNIDLPNKGGKGDYLLSVTPTFGTPYFMRYVLSVNAYCTGACAYQPYQP